MTLLRPDDSYTTVTASGYAYNKIIYVQEEMKMCRLEKGDKERFTISDALDTIVAVFEGAEEDRNKLYTKVWEIEELQKYWDDDFDVLRAEGRIP